MNLQEEYTKSKKGNMFLINFLNLLASMGILFVVNLLWNYLAPVWGIPVLTYLQFLGTLFLILTLKHFLGFTVTNGNVQPLSLHEILEVPTNEEQ